MKVDEIITLILDKEKEIIEAEANIRKYEKEMEYLKKVKKAYCVEIDKLFAIIDKCDDINEEYMHTIRERMKTYDSK